MTGEEPVISVSVQQPGHTARLRTCLCTVCALGPVCEPVMCSCVSLVPIINVMRLDQHVSPVSPGLSSVATDTIQNVILFHTFMKFLYHIYVSCNVSNLP